MANHNGTFQNFFNDLAGQFTQHIHQSIPGYQSMEVGLAKALAERSFPEDKVLDIGASEGTFNLLFRTFGGKGTFVNLDPSNEMEDTYRDLRTKAELNPNTNQFLTECFGESFDPVNFPSHSTERKYNVILEKFTFQFIGDDREQQIGQVKKHLSDNGVAIFFEKFKASEGAEKAYQLDEEVKNRYKAEFFSQDEISGKAKEVLLPMGECMATRSDMEVALLSHFEEVECIWACGNFRAYLASDHTTSLESRIFHHAQQHLNQNPTPETSAYRQVYGSKI